MQNPIFPLGWPVQLDLKVHDTLVEMLQKIHPGSMADSTLSGLINHTIIELAVSFRRSQLQDIQARRDSDYRQYLDTLRVIIELANAFRQ
jgi:hypothetical protein